MFYHGGMTLGYLRAAGQDKAKPETTTPHKSSSVTSDREKEHEQELSRAFITPWHLFY